VGDFSAEWLALREPADHAARSGVLTRTVIDSLPAGPIGIVDLACGTGSNLRYLQPRISGTAEWILVDDDAALLARVPAGPHITTRRQNLATLDPSLFEGQTLITASALLDLVSPDWVRALATHCRANGTAVLFALTYDGRIEFAPDEPEDTLVRDLVNRHQRTDKGFGAALGPDAPVFAGQCFAAAGYQVRREPSDWVLGVRELQRQLIKGWADAAADAAPDRAAEIDRWRRRRDAHIDAGRSRIRVGHQDIAAISPG
jgi:hypothetical protein